MSECVPLIPFVAITFGVLVILEQRETKQNVNCLTFQNYQNQVDKWRDVYFLIAFGESNWLPLIPLVWAAVLLAVEAPFSCTLDLRWLAKFDGLHAASLSTLLASLPFCCCFFSSFWRISVRKSSCGGRALSRGVSSIFKIQVNREIKNNKQSRKRDALTFLSGGRLDLRLFNSLIKFPPPFVAAVVALPLVRVGGGGGGGGT